MKGRKGKGLSKAFRLERTPALRVGDIYTVCIYHRISMRTQYAVKPTLKDAQTFAKAMVTPTTSVTVLKPVERYKAVVVEEGLNDSRPSRRRPKGKLAEVSQPQ